MLVFKVVGSTRFGTRFGTRLPGIPSYFLDSIKNVLTVYEFGGACPDPAKRDEGLTAVPVRT